MTTLRQAIRSISRAPGLGLAAVFCIALGVAATIAVATLAERHVVASGPLPRCGPPGRIWFEEPDVNPRIGLSIPDTSDFVRMTHSMRLPQRLACERRCDSAAARNECAARVCPRLFRDAGLSPALGRLLLPVRSRRTINSGSRPQPWHVGAADRRDPASVAVSLDRTDHIHRSSITPLVLTAPLKTMSSIFIPIEHYEPQSSRTGSRARPAWSSRARAGSVRRRSPRRKPRRFIRAPRRTASGSSMKDCASGVELRSEKAGASVSRGRQRAVRQRHSCCW